MKKGDVVTIKDGSYAKSVIGGKIVHEFLNCGDERDKQYIVIETDCSFPLESNRLCNQPEAYRNDTVIQAVDSGKVVFIYNRFLSKLTRKKPNKQARRARKMAKRKMFKGLTAPLQGGRR